MRKEYKQTLKVLENKNKDDKITNKNNLHLFQFLANTFVI